MSAETEDKVSWRGWIFRACVGGWRLWCYPLEASLSPRIWVRSELTVDQLCGSESVVHSPQLCGSESLSEQGSSLT